MNALSPLRYPGGKACLHSTMIEIISANHFVGRHYFEPYAGGCGLALSLLRSGHVTGLSLNDLDRSIYAFWQTILTQSEEFIQKIQETSITLVERDRQLKIQAKKTTVDLFELAFSTFFLNRVNYSGVIRGGVIGGRAQTGKYKIDCRFNKERLIEQIRWVADNRHRIHFYNMDALEFMHSMKSSITAKNSLIYLDPPYFHKGCTLYTNYYQANDHADIAQVLQNVSAPWVLTYDNTPEIKILYQHHQQYQFNLFYNVGNRRLATELLIANNNVVIPLLPNLSLLVA